MNKKPKDRQKARAEAAAPQPAQVDSIERLLDEGRLHEAVAKADRLGAQFPTHVRLRDLRIRAVASAGDVPRAALMAEEWSRSQPNSQRGWNLLFSLAADLGLGYLAHEAHVRLDALGGVDAKRTQDAETLIQAIRAKYAELSDEEGLRSDRGLLFLIGERLDEAAAELAHATHPVPRTNLAAVHFDLGDMGAAIAVARAAWEADECNAHAARILVRALLYAGDVDAAEAAGAKLRAVQTREPDELSAQLETLDLLEDYAGARERFEAFPLKDFQNFRRDMLGRMRHAAAVAYFNLDDRNKARLLWQQAAEDHPDHPLYQANLLRVLRADASEPAWRELMSEAFPTTVAKVLQQDVDKAGGTEAVLADLQRLKTPLVAHSAYLGRLLRQTDPLCRGIVREAISHRVEQGEAAAETALRQFLSFGHGNDHERMEALRALYFAGRLPSVGPVSVHLEGALRTLDVTVPAVRRDVPLPGLPEAAQQDYFQAVYADQPGELRAALDRLRKWQAEVAPGFAQKALVHRVILLLHGLRERGAEGAALLQETLNTGAALARTYAFAARLALARGQQAEAERLLNGQLARAGHCDEDLAPVLTAQAELQAARGLTDAALSTRIALNALGAFAAPEV